MVFQKYNALLKQHARSNRKAGNLVEVLLWNCLKSKQLGYTFNRQKPIGNYIVDFLCKELMLIIEIDGSTHDENLDHDAERESRLKGLGYSVLRFQNDDVLHNLDGVVYHIRAWVEGRS